MSHYPVPVRVVNDPLITKVVEDNELGFFERQTLSYARWGFFVGVCSLLLVAGTAVVFWDQFREMSAQTGILAMSAHQARRDSAEASVTTAKQLGIVEQQAAASVHQAANLSDQLRLQRELARVDRGDAILSVYGIGAFYSDSGKAIQIDVSIQNNGRVTPASQISIAARMAFRDSRPRFTVGDFRERFKSTETPVYLLPFDTTRPWDQDRNTRVVKHAATLRLSSNDYARHKHQKGEIYVWGVIHHRQYGEVVPRPFC